ncbi:acid protease [Delitschia confertaspora ATCC 74209]|uniref:Acid protease n=1 Tax=Delitschia confertaspora ATCC 74209 TaxID=1513339 RepID=A0A9P4MR36_9PLEO|nr:acid protease [Delitschia confertaspora ATCC 74209]
MLRYQGDRYTHFAVCILFLATLLSQCLGLALALDLDLERRASQNATIAEPISLKPAQDWDGIDGQWSVFPLSVGEPAQWVRTIVSTASQQTWVVIDMACEKNQTDENNVTSLVRDDSCWNNRGHTFNPSASTTWHNRGFYLLWTEQVMGLDGNGKYGFDTVGIGYLGERGPTLKNTTVGALITPNFWLGHFGLNPKPTNFSAFEDPSPSYMTQLFQQNMIPSLSFGYTAGARYRFTSVLSSLTLGGYDTSRYIPNDLTFGFAPDNERDLVVPLVGIHANSATKSNVSLLTDPISVYIDSTLAELYLPTKLCKAFEDTFGLKYDNETELYLVNDMQHQQLLAENPNITFTLGQKYVTNSTIDIVLPYAAFDLRAKPPYRGLQNESYFFPIRRAANDAQFVFGRTFLQEAYLVVDWERQNFSVYQSSWVFGAQQNIVPIISPTLTRELEKADHRPKSTHIATGRIIGIAIGSGFAVALVCFGIGWWYLRKKHINKIKAEYAKRIATAKDAGTEKPPDPPLSPTEPEGGTNVFPKVELPADVAHRRGFDPDLKEEDPTSPIVSPMVEAENNQIFEMEGDIPVRQEADGRQMSEKEGMVFRERIYNGIDPTWLPAVRPMTEEPPRRLAPVSPSEVTMIRHAPPQPQNVSPITPHTPRDGASLEAGDTFFQPPSTRIPRDGRFLEADNTILSPISPLDGGSTGSDPSRRRFSYED